MRSLPDLNAVSNSVSEPAPPQGVTPLSLLQTLRARMSRRQSAPPVQGVQGDRESRIASLPPLEAHIAVLSAQRNKWKFLCMASLAGAGLGLASLGYLLNHKMFEKMGSEFIVVPGAADYVRVRPNLIPDEAVFAFAEYVASYAGTFSYRNAKNHFVIVGERMVPELKGRFLRDTDARLTEWMRRRVDQVFAYEPVRRFDVLSDKFGSKYALVVKGPRAQYADGTLIQESTENLYLVLRPRLSVNPGTRADESLFQIERLDWVTSAQAETLLATRVREDPAKSPKQ